MMLCVVAHDAGGAEVIASYIARTGTVCRYVLAGPAINVFRRRLGDIELTDLNTALLTCNVFLCGTSWQSDLEWRAISEARARAIICYSFLDHWGHYRERFIRDGVEVLPDELWLGDEIGERLARELFPDTPLRLEPNPYFQDIREEFDRLQSVLEPTDGLRILFVCEPLSEHGLAEFGDARHWGYTEFDALRFFFAHLSALGAPVSSVTVRPHPSEARGKYDAICREFDARIGGSKTLFQEIAESDVVVGCESMAMVVGLLAGRRVVSAIPPEGRPGGLPQPEIEVLQTLIENKKI